MPASTETKIDAAADKLDSVEGPLPLYGPYIDGSQREPVSKQYFETFDPYSGHVWALVGRCGSDDVDLSVAAAKGGL